MSKKSSSSIVPREPRGVATGIARRDFLRACAVTGVGLASGFQHHVAQAAGVSPASGGPPSGDIVVGLEIGESKVCAAVAERLSDGTVKIRGIGHAQSWGVGRCGIVAFEAAARCVRAALVKAEANADVMIGRVVLAVAGATAGPFSSAPKTAADICEREDICYAHPGDGRLRRIRRADCSRAKEWHVMESAGTRIENSIRCISTLGVAVEALFHAPVASAEAVLDANRKNLGALVIDIGGGSTDYAVYAGGALRQNGCVMFGSQDIRQELACQLRLPFASGEKLLIEEGSVRLGQPPLGERLVVDAGPGSIPREIERETLNTIVRRSVRRALRSVKQDIALDGVRLDSLLAGVQLTGGCSLLPGIRELAAEVFGIPASRAHLHGISTAASSLKFPRFSCALGLAKLAAA